jgi:riboflavin kinase/FMN adenylyltransferase
VTCTTVWWRPGMDPLGRSVVALGVFDGVHIGHQTLVRDAITIARGADARAVVLTFDRDPDQVVMPSVAPLQLLTLDDKLEFLCRQGADIVLVLPFTAHLARMAPLAFLDQVLLESMTPVSVVVGCDFRFGHHAEGNVDLLVRYGAQNGFTVLAHDLVPDHGATISSTRIRGLVAAGDVAEAARLLGRPHRLSGEVGRGRGEGAALDAPTANLLVAANAAVPADGVYAGRVTIGGVAYAAAISVGLPPSFPQAADALEVHLLDFRGDLYGRTLTVEFLQRLRSHRTFDDPRDLAAAIQADIAQVRLIAS